MKRRFFRNFITYMTAIMFAAACSSSSDPEIQPDDDDQEIIDTTDDELVPNSQDLSSLTNAVFIVFNDTESRNTETTTASEANATVTSDLTSFTYEIDGNHVTITSTADAGVNYVLSGVTTDGSFTITSDNKFNLYLNGTGISNPSGAAINSTQKAVSVTIVDATQNRLIDSETSSIKAAFFSKGKMSFDGSGTLEVRGKVKHAIASGNGMTINSGTIFVKEAASDAIHADGITVTGGTITTVSAGEGFDADDYGDIEISGGTITMVTTGKKGHGIKTSSDDTTGNVGNITISGGTINITTQGIASKAINSDGDITLSGGTYTLKTTGSAYFDTDDQDTSSSACIKCDGNLEIYDGIYTITSTGAGGKGINVGGTLDIYGGTFTVTTSGNQYVYNSNYDTASKAIKSTGNLTIYDGDIMVKTSTTEAEGIESKATLTIKGGNIIVEAYDDCLNASNHIQIDGGNIYCYSTINDGIDSNGTLTVTGGVVISSGYTAPEEGFDCDNNTFTITGGTLIGTGGATSTPTSSSTNQNSLIWQGTSATAGQVINIAAADGTSILTYKLPRTYSSMTLLFSSPGIARSTTYTIKTGGTISGYTSEFYGMYTGGTYSGGSTATSFTTSSSNSVTTEGSASGGGQGGGGGGRP